MATAHASGSGPDKSPEGADGGTGRKSASSRPLLEVEDLRTHFYGDRGVSKAVDGVSFEVNAGEIVGVVGESGCGKSVTALSLMRLVQHPGKIVGGRVRFQGEELLGRSEREMRAVRGRRIAMIFQDPLTTLNPVLRVGEQIAESIRVHHKDGTLSDGVGGGQPGGARWWLGAWTRHRDDVWARAVDMMEQVGIPAPDQRMREFPHQFSGGMRQRVMIAIALAANPSLLLADEPTTALDVTIQAQILDLMTQLQKEFGMAIILITHDLGVVAKMADRVLVMYAGQEAESGGVNDVFYEPTHPYTQGLLGSIPNLRERQQDLLSIPGTPPDLFNPPAGCSFFDRCPHAMEVCRTFRPELLQVDGGHRAACWLTDERAKPVVAARKEASH